MTQQPATTAESDTMASCAVPRRYGVRRWVAAAAIIGVAITGYHVFWHYHLKRFATVRPGVLYRSGQPSELGLWYARHRYGVRTVLNARRYRKPLRNGVVDFGDETGDFEGDYVRQLGACYLQWPQGDQKCWPWPTPAFYEKLFRLLDDPTSYPLLVHCMGGRHRTGTVAALFRLEYDRWPVERALDEMYSFEFGDPIAIHEHNLRTYWPRPRPDERTWQRLLPQLLPYAGATPPERPDAFTGLVDALKKRRSTSGLDEQLRQVLVNDEPFGLPLVARFLEAPDDPLAAHAVERAVARLDQPSHPADELATAAAIVADFGQPRDQRRLLDTLVRWQGTSEHIDAYEAVVAGVTNRYTLNRIPYLAVLLDDTRARRNPSAARYRYCDAAVARISVILDRNFVEFPGTDGGVDWDRGRRELREWLNGHPEQLVLRPLVLPGDTEPVRPDPDRIGEEAVAHRPQTAR